MLKQKSETKQGPVQMSLFSSSEGDNYFDKLCSQWGVALGPGWPDRFGTALRHWSKSALKMPIRTLSLFSGMGGLDIAFHDAGFLITDMVEIEKKFATSLIANTQGPEPYLQEANVHCVDIREFTPAIKQEFDFIIGGPPCQTFSAAARRASGVSGLNDNRGTLFHEYVRLLRQLQPKGFLFENVYGITGANGGEAWKQIQEAFEGAGYRVYSRILDTADYGVPQHRERMFIVGLKNGAFNFPRPTHGPDSECSRPYYTAGEAVEGVALSTDDVKLRVTGRYEGLLEQVPPGLNYSYFTEKMGHPSPLFAWRSKFSDFLYKADPKTPIRTLKAQAGQFTGPFHWANRPFSIGEFKRLQTTPDRYQVTGKRQVALHQIGNSVPSQVGRILAIAVLEQVFGISPPIPVSYLAANHTLGFRKRKRGLTTRYRDAAATAIDGLATTETEKFDESRQYSRCLSEKFHWKESDLPDSMVVQVESCRQRWVISVADRKVRRKSAAMILKLSPAKSGWGIPVSEVQLVANAVVPRLFTGAWKAFEEELIQKRFKADLVQLCNYYQYEPLFKASIQFPGKPPLDPLWNIVGKVCEGLGVRCTIPQADLAELWDIRVDEVLPSCIFLKKLGYEVRNSSTNPEMPAGSFLIPYSFPTFNPRSVQLNKSLTLSNT